MNKRRNINALLLKLAPILVLIMETGILKGQVSDISSDTSNIKNFREEIYVQTDRDYYITGEQVWLKVIKINRLNSAPENESKVVYMELLDNSGNLVRQTKVAADEHSASASIRLPDTLRTGNYLLRAYTSWMMNSGENLFFYKYISVINPFFNIERLIATTRNNTVDSVKLFPEGGSFIAGKRTRVGIRSTSTDGSLVKAEGSIVNDKGEEIIRFQTDSSGFGIITLTPALNDKLYVQFKTTSGILKKQQLGEIREGGISLSAEPALQDHAFLVKLARIGAEGHSYRNGKLETFSSGLLTFSRNLNFEVDTAVRISFSELPSGSSKIVLSGIDGKKLAGRWIYNDDQNNLNLSISMAGTKFETRQRVDLDVSSLVKPGNGTIADLSVSVVKKCLIADDRIDITRKNKYSAVPGEWHSSLSTGEMNDRLLVYRDIPDTRTGRQYLPELGGELVSGVLRAKQNHDILKGTDISLAFVGKTAKCQFVKTDSAGEFNFVVNKPGLSEIVIQLMNPISSGYYVEFDQPFCTTFNDHIPPVFSFDSSRTEALNKAIVSMQVSKIYDPLRKAADKKPVMNDGHDFYGEADKVINISDYIELNSVREILKEIVPDIIVIKRNKEYFFKLVNLPNSNHENNPLVLVDGVPFYNLARLLEVNGKDIERIAILNSKYYYTNYKFDGIVNFVTRKGNLSAMEYDNSVFRQVFEGSQLPQEFYSPDYSAKADSSSRIPDTRNTLYWNPGLHTDKTGKASATFFTSDEPGDYVITVEGISSDGRTGISRVGFTVK